MRVLYVDDELPAIAKFAAIARQIKGIDVVASATNAQDALKYVRENPVDTALLDIEMPGMRGIDLARKLHEINENIKIFFLTAYDQYALQAFEVDALGYLLKPLNKETLERELEKARRMRNVPKKIVYIQTIPTFDVYVDGSLLPLSSPKPKELLAILVDRNGSSITSGQAISMLWEDRPNDEKTKALYRMTVKRLKEILTVAEIDFIMNQEGTQRFIRPDMFACDYFRFLNGDQETIAKYNGEYMAEYSWAEETNARLMNQKMECEESRRRK